MEYSVFNREVEDGILAACHELGIALVAYSPFGSGMLAADGSSYADLRRRPYLVTPVVVASYPRAATIISA
jgi:aryl-alcohol dehydrogenase-like predicted oxidoreductase